MKKPPLFTLPLFLAISIICHAQPKLLVGLVIDQMRYDYIEKYWDKYGEGGFKRLVNEGFNCKNTNYNYVPTFTGPGHASIFTGMTPSVHGIVGNDWIDLVLKRQVYCVGDRSVAGVGGTKGASGQMSPKNLFRKTIGDELKTKNKNSKVIGIALKDRGAILPAGQLGNAAYWFDVETGFWISSTKYMKDLPKWVNDFNFKEPAKTYLSQMWNTLYPINTYSESDPDNNPCEEPFKGKELPVFPYDLNYLMNTNGGAGLIRSTPFGNSLTKDFAIETIKNEQLGKGLATDMFCVSFSSTDYIGHQFGPQSIEVEDCYLRLDKDLEALLLFLDKWLGKDNVLLFLTSDHGVSETVPCLQKKHVDAGVLVEKLIADSLKQHLTKVFGDTISVLVNDFDVYFDQKRIEQKNLNFIEVKNAVVSYLKKMNGIADAVTSNEIQEDNFADGSNPSRDSLRVKVKAGYNAGRSGQVVFILKPGWLIGFYKGATHGSPYIYDTHVPLLWWGSSIKQGNSELPITITQIVPTLSEILKVSVPEGCVAKPISFDK